MIELNRFCVFRTGCPHCLEAVKAILFINRHLPYEKRIQLIDNYEYEDLRITGMNPFIDERLDPKIFTGYPYINIDGTIIEPAIKELLIIAIAQLVNQDFILDMNYDGVLIKVGAEY